jgi:hypothetical protein
MSFVVHGPWPLAYPHVLSAVSQTLELQTTAPAAAVQVPFSGGFECGGSFGIGEPSGSYRSAGPCGVTPLASRAVHVGAS